MIFQFFNINFFVDKNQNIPKISKKYDNSCDMLFAYQVFLLLEMQLIEISQIYTT